MRLHVDLLILDILKKQIDAILKVLALEHINSKNMKIEKINPT